MKTEAFPETFATLRGVLDKHAKNMLVHVDKPGDYQLCSPSKTDRIGRPLFIAKVQTKKNYVSFHRSPRSPSSHRWTTTRRSVCSRAVMRWTTCRAAFATS